MSSVISRGKKALQKLAKHLQGSQWSIGILPLRGAKPHGATTVAEIGAAHEYGLGVPERSWLRGYLDENENMIAQDMVAAWSSVVAMKRTAKNAAGMLGAKHSAGMKKRISDKGVKPDISERTKEKKGSDVPLLDTGVLRASISFKVESK